MEVASRTHWNSLLAAWLKCVFVQCFNVGTDAGFTQVFLGKIIPRPFYFVLEHRKKVFARKLIFCPIYRQVHDGIPLNVPKSTVCTLFSLVL